MTRVREWQASHWKQNVLLCGLLFLAIIIPTYRLIGVYDSWTGAFTAGVLTAVLWTGFMWFATRRYGRR